MKGSKILLGICAAAMAVVLIAPASHAQCPVTQEFGAQGNGGLTGRIIVDVGSAADATGRNYPANGNEHISVWNSLGGAADVGIGPHFPGSTDTCTGWWVTGGMFLGVNAGIQGLFGTPTCGLLQCPDDNARVTTLVEDQNPGGTNAGFVLYSVDATFAAIRPWDHARTAGIAGVPSAVAIHRFENYPTVFVTSSSGPPPNTTLTSNYLDLALNFHGAGTAAQANSAILAYTIVAHQGTADPGRQRSAYSLGTVATIAYANAGVTGHMVAVPCGSPLHDTYLAVGASFRSGGQSVPSILVGRAVPVECDPNIANPQQPMIERAPQRSRKQMGQIGR